MTRLEAFLGVSRAPFLILSPLCVLLGFALAWVEQNATGASGLSLLTLLLTLVGGLSAHIAVNALNEWSDYRSGLDKLTTRTPFSGGSGTLLQAPEWLNFALGVGLFAVGLTVACGLVLTLRSGPGLWLLGLIGVLIILTYTPYINRRPLLCLIAPGVGFGTLMVTGAHYAAAGQFSAAGWAVSLPMFFLVSNLLFLNQFPDIEADRQVGRHHIPMAIGKTRAARVYVLMLGAAFISIGLSVALELLPPGALLGLLPIVPGVILARGVLQHAEDIERLKPFMGLNVVVTLAVPACLSLGLVLPVWMG